MPEPAQPPAPPRRWAGDLPRAVWLVTGLFAALLAAYTMIFPAYRGPDEPQHADLILFIREEVTYPGLGERFLAASVEESMRVVRFGRDSRHLTADAAPPRDRRPPLDEATETRGGRVNQMPQHPPLYYGAMAAGTAAVDALTPGNVATRGFDRTLGLMRLLNVLLLVPIPLLAFLAVRRLGGGPEAALAAAIVPLAIPQLAHIGSAVNNDNLLTLAVGALTLPLVAVAAGHRSLRTAAGIGLLGGAALLTKGFGLVVLPWIGAAYLLAGVRRRPWWPTVAAFAVGVGTALAVGGWWWIRNLVVFGRVQPGLGRLADAGAGFQPDPLWWLRRFGAWMVERFWGWFGWFDVRMPLAAIAIAAAVVGVGVIAALAVRRRGWRRADVALVLLPVVGIAAIVAVGAYRTYARTGLTAAIQGRYLFPGVVGLAAAAGLGLSTATGRARRWLPLALLVGAGAMHLLALRAVLPFYWGPPVPTSVGERVRAMLAWAPWPAPVWWGIVAAVAALGAWLAVDLARRAATADAG